jgi:RNA polymerase sigma-70 factor, ECF subfamily
MNANAGREDRWLAQAVVERGDEHAFRILYRRHSASLYRVLLRVLSASGVEAEDALQETWIRAVRALPQFRWESALGTWLVGIGVNVARERLRAPRRTVEIEEAGHLASRSDPSLRIDLESAIAQLPEEGRTVLILHDVEGYTHEEISAALGIADGTSKSRLSRARQNLKEFLAPKKGASSA